MNDTTNTTTDTLPSCFGVMGRMSLPTTGRMPSSIKWTWPGKGNSKWPQVYIIRPWRGVTAGDVVCVERASLWALLACGAVVELCKADDEEFNCVLDEQGRVIPIVWHQAPDADAADGVARWGVLDETRAIVIGPAGGAAKV